LKLLEKLKIGCKRATGKRVAAAAAGSAF